MAADERSGLAAGACLSTAQPPHTASREHEGNSACWRDLPPAVVRGRIPVHYTQRLISSLAF